MHNSQAHIKQERTVSVEATSFASPSQSASDSAIFDETPDVKNVISLSKTQLHNKINAEPDSFTFESPMHTKSAVWTKHDFRFIVYNNVKQKFVICMNCKSILSYTGRTGTASLLRHKCEKGPRTPKDKKPIITSSTPCTPTRLPANKVVKTYFNTEQLMEIETDDIGMETSDDFDGGANKHLTVKEVLSLIAGADPDIEFRPPLPESDFTVVYYKDNRQNYASCNQCKNIVYFSPLATNLVTLNHACSDDSLGVFEPNDKADDDVEQDEEFCVEKLCQDLYSVDERSLRVTAAGDLLNTGPGQLVQHIVQLICQSCKSFETLVDGNFEKLVQCLLGLGEKDRAIVSKHFTEIVTNIRYVLLPELETQLQAHIIDATNARRASTFGNTCFACDLWTKRALLWATSVSQDFYFHKVFVGSAAEKEYSADFLRKLLTACGLEFTRHTKVVANEECASVFTKAEPCILDSIRQIFVDFFNSVKTDDQFIQSLLYYYNLSASQRNDPAEEATLEISLDLDFAIALAKSYPTLAAEAPHEDGRPSLGTFFDLVQPFVDCIESLTADTNPNINEVYLWKKRLENVFERRPADDKVAIQMAGVFGALIKSSFLTSDAQKVAVLFDPNFKSLKFLNETEKQEVLAIVRGRFDHLKPAVPKVKKEPKPATSSSVVAKKFAEFADVDNDADETPTDTIDYEIKRYVDLRLDGPVDMLEFWRQATGFPNLKQLCREILAIPACSQQNLLKYSSGGRVLKEQCMGLKPEEFNTVLAIHYAMKK